MSQRNVQETLWREIHSKARCYVAENISGNAVVLGSMGELAQVAGGAMVKTR